MLFQSQIPQLFNRIGFELFAESNAARKAEAAKRLNFYHDAQLERLEEQLNEHFSEPERMVKCCLNITKKIINNLSQVYQLPPARSLENASEKDQEIFKQILENANFDARMKQAQRYAKLLKTVLVRPVWRKNSIQIDVLTGNLLDVATDESPENLQKVLITDYGTSGRIDAVEYSLWDAEGFARLDHRGKIIDQQPNPYGVLPFVPIWDYPPPSGSFWLPGLDDLISIQESINLKLTDLLYLIAQQSFGVGFIKGAEGGTLKVDPGTLVQLPENGAIGFESQKGEIAQVINAIDKLAKWACVANGLSAGSMSTDPTEQSGIAKAWDSKELQETRSDDLSLWRTYEKQVFNLVRIVHNAHAPGRKLSEAASLRIDFADPAARSMSAKEQAEADNLKIAQGVLSSVDIILRDNPDFQNDRESALAHLVKIRDEMRLLSE